MVGGGGAYSQNAYTIFSATQHLISVSDIGYKKRLKAIVLERSNGYR